MVHRAHTEALILAINVVCEIDNASAYRNNLIENIACKWSFFQQLPAQSYFLLKIPGH